MSRELFHADGLAEAAVRIRRLEARLTRLEEHVMRLEAALADRALVERLFGEGVGEGVGDSVRERT